MPGIASKAANTPGPWSVGHTRMREYAGRKRPEAIVHVGHEQNRGNAIAIVYMGGKGAISYQVEDVEANARLIAAAPDLLEALRDLLANYTAANMIAAAEAIEKASNFTAQSTAQSENESG